MQTTVRQIIAPEQALLRAKDLYEENKLQACEKLCRDVIAAKPDSHAAYFQLALVAIKVGRLMMAANLLSQALQIEPKALDYQRALGEVFRRMGDFESAVAHGRKAIALAPNDAESHYNLGIALADSGKLDDAVAEFGEALRIRPGYSVAHNNMGTALERLGNIEEAEKAYREAIRSNPSNAQAQNNLGAILSERGDLDEAKKCFEAAVMANPMFVHAHYNLSSLKTYTPDDPHVALLERLRPAAENMAPEDRLRYCFAVAKAYEDIGRYDESFAAYSQGNKLKRMSYKFDINTPVKRFAHIEKAYDKDFAKKKVKGCADETPVFIVGMPRSGTTLIEQVLASHSKVYGAGELKDLMCALDDVMGKPRENGEAPELRDAAWLMTASDKDIELVGKNYIERIRKLDKKALRITDKMPGNFFFVGLIHKALPNAKIIHSVRNPYDTCISNYSKLFNESVPFAYDLSELGQYYSAYARLMDHWKSVLPKGRILDVVYEDMVDDIEGQAKRLIDFCGLDWEDSCLEFYNNKRKVKTASIAQVRQPIYKDSLGRAQRFEKHIGPLIEAIEGKGKQ